MKAVLLHLPLLGLCSSPAPRGLSLPLCSSSPSTLRDTQLMTLLSWLPSVLAAALGEAVAGAAWTDAGPAVTSEHPEVSMQPLCCDSHGGGGAAWSAEPTGRLQTSSAAVGRRSVRDGIVGRGQGVTAQCVAGCPALPPAPHPAGASPAAGRRVLISSQHRRAPASTAPLRGVRHQRAAERAHGAEVTCHPCKNRHGADALASLALR